MEKLSTIYASALFDLAVQLNAVDEFLGQAELLHKTLSDSGPERMLLNPRITTQQKREFFRDTFDGKLHPDLLSFLYLVTDKNRVQFLLPALSKLVSNVEQYKNIVKAKVVSAAPYDNAQTASLKAMLSKKLGKIIELEVKVDPKLIGGPYIFADGYHIDWTVKRRLSELTVNLKEGCSA